MKGDEPDPGFRRDDVAMQEKEEAARRATDPSRS
jgi:hypothetical protein